MPRVEINDENRLKYEKNIISTLSFFQIFKYPLTASEIFFNLIGTEKIDWYVFKNVLDNLVLEQKIFKKHNLYFLDLENLDLGLNKRHNSYLEQFNKLLVAKKAVKLIKYLPFVRAVFVCNSVALGLAHKRSDIDLFIISERNKVWLVRFLITLILSLSGLRNTKTKTANRICLSFFCSIDNLKLKPANNFTDIYLGYWLKHLVPLYDEKQVLQKIKKANKNFLKTIFVNDFLVFNYNNYWFQKIKFERIKVLIEKVFSFFVREFVLNLLYKFQVKHLQKIYQENFNSVGVEINKDIAKLYFNDRREIYYEQWQKNKNKYFKF